jgi:ABC-type lipoprotein export system ATPase subunit
MFQALSAEEGITVVLVTHDAGVASYAQRAIRMADGLIEEGAFDGNVQTVPAGAAAEAIAGPA